MGKSLLNRIGIATLLLFITLVFSNQIVYSQAVINAETESAGWTELFDDYVTTWSAKSGGGQNGMGASGTSTNYRARKIALKDISGLCSGNFNISVSFFDGDGSSNASQFWLQIGDRNCEVTSQANICNGTGFLANIGWNPSSSTNALYTFTDPSLNNIDIDITTNDSVYLYYRANSTSNWLDKVIFTSNNLSNPAIAPQSFSVNECATIGTGVGTVSASDADGDGYTFSITGGTGSGLFTINSFTGAITVAGTLDYESRAAFSYTYTLTVRADDDGCPSKNASNTITINVTDCANDNAPVVVPNTFSVAENSVNGTAVGTATATDGDGNSVTFSIVSGNTGGAFSIDPTTGAITVNGSINYEALTSYSLVVLGTDDGSPSKSSTGTYTINVTDVNENPNAPTISTTSMAINENSSIGTVVGTISANDGDILTLGQVLTYSITGGTGASRFSINPTTGEVTVNGILDYETTGPTHILSIDVHVADNGSPSKSITKTINITINDVSDSNVNAPVIAVQNFSVDENSTYGTIVGRVIASDPDWYQTLTFSEQTGGGSTGNAVFDIDPATGNIIVVGALDKETTASYKLLVRATDNGIPSLNAQALMNITINDLNETGVFPFILRDTWDGPYDVRMIAAPSLEAVYVNSAQAASNNIYVDSVIDYATQIMADRAHVISINNDFSGGPKSVTLKRPAIVCANQDVACTLGYTLDPATSSCPVKYNSTVSTVTAKVTMSYADYDNDLSTFSSSMAELDIADCAEIESAYLYWAGTMGTGSYSLLDGPLNSYSAAASGVAANAVFNVSTGFTSTFNTVKFKTPGGSYQTVSATAGNTRVLVAGNTRYLCVADVTSLVQGIGGGQFWVGNVQSYPNDGGGGSASGWVMVFVFRSPLSPPRRIMAWDGLELIPQNGSKLFSLTGLNAPNTLNFNSYVGFAALDGENITSEGVTPANAEGLGFQTNAGGTYVEINPFKTDQPPYHFWTSNGWPAQSNGTSDNKTSCNIPIFDGTWGTGYDGVSSMRITSYDETTGKNGNEITRLPTNPRTLGLDAHHMKLPNGSIASNATQADLTVKAGPQGSTLPFLAYIAIEQLQPKLVLDKTADVNVTATGGTIKYTITVKNEGNYVSTAGDRVYDTLDIATNYSGSFISTPAGVSVVSTTNDYLEFSLPAIAVNGSITFSFNISVLPYTGNIPLWDVQCKRTITNTAWAKYNTATSGMLFSKSNSDDCGIGEETRVLVSDVAFGGSSTTNLGPFNACGYITESVITHVQTELMNVGIPADELDQYDIRTSTYARVQTTDVFNNPVLTYYAIRDYASAGSCQQTYKLVFTACAPLPVELVSFRGWKKDDINILQWTTATEKNNNYFIIERSSNGMDFFPIGTIPGHGNSAIGQNYYFEDANPLNGTNYYRLKQVDYDGVFAYSRAIALNNEGSDMNIYPNPNNGSFTINLLAPDQSYKLDITDVEGREVYAISGDEVPSTIEVNHLAKGLYIVRFYLNNNVIIKKLVVY